MKFLSVIGTRPNFVKEFLVHRECVARGVDKKIVHTGQHYDYEMSQVFFSDFNLPKPDYYLDVPNHDSVSFTGSAMMRMREVISHERPDFLLSYGDVNSTLAAAVAAVKMGVPFAHVEGGIRSSDLYNPEEINRRVADVLAEVIYCCTETDAATLRREGYQETRIVFSGDLMKDALLSTLKSQKIPISQENYMVLTLHRRENVRNRDRLEAIVDGLVATKQRIVFPVHPGTRIQLERNGLMQKLGKSRIELIKPLGYVEFLRLAAAGSKILTDSGGVRREAYLLGKPCIVLIEISWFPDITKAGWNVLVGPNPEKIRRTVTEFSPVGPRPNIFGDGNAHKKILDDLEERFGRE